jgi:hypothetical protein
VLALSVSLDAKQGLGYDIPHMWHACMTAERQITKWSHDHVMITMLADKEWSGLELHTTEKTLPGLSSWAIRQ